ncbi:MAG: hypothetical protein ACYTFA_01130 [Planctomycetota bacterium]|jgi:phosphohistidine phosphatase
MRREYVVGNGGVYLRGEFRYLTRVEPMAQARRGYNRKEDMMVVGHLPFMAKLVSHLIVSDEAASTVAYQPGTIVCLELTEEEQWHVAWMLRPELLTGASI